MPYQGMYHSWYAHEAGDWNDTVARTRSRFRLVPGDGMGSPYRADLRAVMRYISARYAGSLYQPQFASGGPVTSAAAGARVSQGIPQWQPAPGNVPPGVTPGMTGFSGAGRLPARELAGQDVPDVPDSFEPVRGYRWWTLDAAPVDGDPAYAERDWPHSLLRGARDTWQPGENTARCLAPDKHSEFEIPFEPCGCGVWAYWQLQQHDLGGHGFPVCGVIEGYGQVILGERGFRAAKARIIALAVPFTIVPVSAARRMRGSPWASAGFTGTVHYLGMDDPDRAAGTAPDAAAARAAEERDQADADAWMGIISDRLAVTYPGARVFETQAAMLAAFPPDPAHGPQLQPCPYCGELTGNMYKHISSACGTAGLIR